MKKLKLIVWLLLFGTMSFSMQAQGTTNQTERMKKLAEDYRAAEGEILFFGQVVDQFTNPVAGADVEVSVPVENGWGRPMSYDKRTLKTDKDGSFEVSSKAYGVSQLKGHYLDIKEIMKDGYGGGWYNGTNNGFSFSLSNSQRFQPDPEHPVIYHLRKKLLPEVLLIRNDPMRMNLPASWSGWTNGYDLIEHCQIQNLSRLELNYHPVVPDILMTPRFNTNDGRWTVTLSSGSTNGGILVADQLLYEAPESGYQAQYTFSPTNDPQHKVLRFYLKSREPALYTRVDLDYIRVSPDEFFMQGKTWTNPYGDRDMEEAVDLPGKLLIQLEEEVRTAFRANKRPVRPDLPKLIKESKSKGN